MIRLSVTYWNGSAETFAGSESQIERLFKTLSALRTVRSLVMEG